MALERKCENCANNETSSCDNCYNFFYFAPIEELVRQDERNKVFEEIANTFYENINICFKYNGETYRIVVEKE